MDLVLRRFATRDASALTALLHRAYAELGERGLNFTAVDQDEATTLARASAGQTWVVEDEAGLFGSLTMSMPPGGELQGLCAEARRPGRAWLNQLAVDPSRRGTGVASRLWAQGRAWAQEAGATHVGLDTAEPATHLVELYRGWGFAEVERICWPGKRYASAVMVRDLPAQP
ncbi:GNAT family N-acetyltransferase [Actinotalea sp. BY-33]|uniref:GNAT family N-acetyltransferase n=1 Tax=Actinotalea soli TaxID=2819234 RepID=A0A939LSE3_9CELL|nr:GNAT family N-acetyltransferase [Actinotalea soli]MBO1751234.1 GNAT family N-acetyltransferase [Actinotalea soli]